MRKLLFLFFMICCVAGADIFYIAPDGSCSLVLMGRYGAIAANKHSSGELFVSEESGRISALMKGRTVALIDEAAVKGL